MRTTKKLLVAAAGLLLTITSSFTQADDLADRINAALSSPQRPEGEQARDQARRPVQVLTFLGVEAGMTVIDVLAGGGWYTEVLSAAVGPQGKVYSQNPERMRERMGEAAKARAGRLGNVELLYSADMTDFGLDGTADFAITALNLHDAYNFRGEQGGLDFLKGVYKALKPGSVLGVIDHAGIAGQDNATLHRIEKSVAEKLITDSGFTIEAESDILHNPDDDHTKPIRDAALQRDTDRFLIKARKPKS
jgi:predicted methyltransferase